MIDMAELMEIEDNPKVEVTEGEGEEVVLTISLA